MARVTSKRQVTIPKTIADLYGIVPGDDIVFTPAGEAIRLETGPSASAAPDRDRRVEEFDRATERQRARQARGRRRRANDRGWTRDELYERGRTR